MFRLILCFCLLWQVSYAQQVFNGHVFENKTRIPLVDIQIQNTRTKQSSRTDAKGRFGIAAAVNDVLIFSGFAYQADTMFLTSLKEAEIFLEPAKDTLKEVKIHASKPINLKTYDPRFHGQTIVEQTDRNGNPVGGIAIRLWWKKDERKRKNQDQQESNEKVNAEIASVFSPANLAKYLPLKNEELPGFSFKYTPSVSVYLSPGFNLVSYLNDCYKEFLKLPPEKRTIPSLKN
jgi:hypothetical protein